MLVTRIAPTPSGYLHAGNAVNFLLTDWLARQSGGRLLLRIDDMDAARIRLPYLEDVFRVIQWLGLSIDGGPGDIAQFQRDYSMALRTDHYRAALKQLSTADGAVFACSCSRRDLVGHDAGCYPGTCRAAGLSWQPGRTSLRVLVPKPSRIALVGGEVDLSEAMGDFVIWRKDDLPAYQLASVIEDRDLGVNAIVRGADLVSSTAAQLFLAPKVGAAVFLAADVRHHPLIRDPAGRKLSKSAGSAGRSIVGDAALLARIRSLAREVAASVSIQPPD